MTLTAPSPAAAAGRPPDLPRLLYLADVPVEASYHGSALLHRLLQNYPPESLRIVESGSHASLPERRLARVNYTALPLGRTRWINTRFSRQVSAWLSLRAGRGAALVADHLAGFQPEAVLTVPHGYGWLAAARCAAGRRVPLHLIIHDDWPRVANLPPPCAAWLDRQFGRVYRQAASRLCVSPFMQENYAARYGVPGTVLYPSRAPDGPVFDAPPERLRQRGAGLTCAYAGTINSEGYARPLRLLAEDLAQVGGRLMLFGPANAADARQMGLVGPNVELRGLVKSAELIHRLRNEADVLFVPMSSAPGERDNMMHGFPSKLTDYTAAGLPLLIHGPEYCSAMRWAREHPGVAELVDAEDDRRLSLAIRRLADDPAHRMSLGARALEVGRRCFAHSVAIEQFHQALDGAASLASKAGVPPAEIASTE
ncbi:MAG: glycosyltransferase [Limisphaerales bacterium]